MHWQYIYIRFQQAEYRHTPSTILVVDIYMSSGLELLQEPSQKLVQAIGLSEVAGQLIFEKYLYSPNVSRPPIMSADHQWLLHPQTILCTCVPIA